MKKTNDLKEGELLCRDCGPRHMMFFSTSERKKKQPRCGACVKLDGKRYRPEPTGRPVGEAWRHSLVLPNSTPREVLRAIRRAS